MLAVFDFRTHVECFQMVSKRGGGLDRTVDFQRELDFTYLEAIFQNKDIVLITRIYFTGSL